MKTWRDGGGLTSETSVTGQDWELPVIHLHMDLKDLDNQLTSSFTEICKVQSSVTFCFGNLTIDHLSAWTPPWETVRVSWWGLRNCYVSTQCDISLFWQSESHCVVFRLTWPPPSKDESSFFMEQTVILLMFLFVLINSFSGRKHTSLHEAVYTLELDGLHLLMFTWCTELMLLSLTFPYITTISPSLIISQVMIHKW